MKMKVCPMKMIVYFEYEDDYVFHENDSVCSDERNARNEANYSQTDEDIDVLSEEENNVEDASMDKIESIVKEGLLCVGNIWLSIMTLSVAVREMQ